MRDGHLVLLKYKHKTVFQKDFFHPKFCTTTMYKNRQIFVLCKANNYIYAYQNEINENHLNSNISGSLDIRHIGTGKTYRSKKRFNYLHIARHNCADHCAGKRKIPEWRSGDI